jgi:hypothetical protein
MTTSARQQAPDDSDLQELYNEVWASFADDDDEIPPQAVVASANRYRLVDGTSANSTSPVSATPSAGSYGVYPTPL